MAVQRGRPLEQHLPDDVGHETHSPGGDVFGDVEVATCAGHPAADAGRRERQRRVPPPPGGREHPGYAAAAYAADGTLEAMEAPGDRFLVAVQWHPETRADAGLFAGLVAAATSPVP